jgi:LacI family transcriptional regulator
MSECVGGRASCIRIARRLGYEPNWAARALNFRIGLCIPKEIHFTCDQMRDGILEEVRHFRHLGVEGLY